MKLHGLAIPTCIFSVGKGLVWLLDMGAPRLPPPKADFFYVANEIFVTCSEQTHNASLMNCGIKTILIFNVTFPINFEPHCT